MVRRTTSFVPDGPWTKAGNPKFSLRRRLDALIVPQENVITFAHYA